MFYVLMSIIPKLPWSFGLQAASCGSYQTGAFLCKYLPHSRAFSYNTLRQCLSYD